jgi:hypothetical protein
MSNPEETEKERPVVRSIVNPAKGVDYYAFVEQGHVSFATAGAGKVLGETTIDKPDQILNGNFQIKQSEIGLNLSARFSWTAYLESGEVVGNHYADIEPLTGNLQNSDMGDMLNTPSVAVTKPDFAMAYGFYDSGSGASGLTSQDQAYVYLTGSRATWMGDLVKEMGSLRSKMR